MNSKSLPITPLAVALLLLFPGCARPGEASVDPNDPAAVSASAQGAEAPATVADQTQPVRRLPRMVDVGAGTCIPCKLMKPILEDLMATRAHQFEIVYVDLNHDRSRASNYRIRVIPTQVIFDEDGREIGRHEGFLSKEEILRAWTDFGYRFEETD